MTRFWVEVAAAPFIVVGWYFLLRRIILHRSVREMTDKLLLAKAQGVDPDLLALRYIADAQAAERAGMEGRRRARFVNQVFRLAMQQATATDRGGRA